MLAVIHGATFGGPCNEIATLAAALEHTQFVVVLPDEPGSAHERLAGAGVEYVRRPMARLRRLRSPGYWLAFPWRFLRDVVAMRDLARRDGVDLIHGYGINLQAAFAARLARVPLVWSLIDSGAPGLIRALAARLLARWSSSVLLDGRTMLSRYPAVGRGRTSLKVYYPPVDLSRFNPRAEGSHGRSFTVGTVANINPDKGLDVLVDAAAIVLEQVDGRFEVTGARHATHDALADGLVAQAARLPNGSFAFLGESDDVPGRLARLDVFVVSSRREGTTTTAIEAMACGLPVVATQVGGVPEVVEHGVTGILVPSGDPAALASAILRLARDPQLRIEMGRRGRERAEERFGSAPFVALVEEAYRDALEGERGA